MDRIAAPKYSPADADIMRARLRTVGVQEHAITLDGGPEPGREWLIYDVGGARSAVSTLKQSIVVFERRSLVASVVLLESSVSSLFRLSRSEFC